MPKKTAVKQEGIALHKAQAMISADRHRFRVVNCGRRFGKTVVAIQEMIGFAYHLDKAQIAYIAPTYQQARDISWNQLKNAARPITAKINESRLEIIVKNKFKTKSTISLRGWESVETVRGQFFHLLVIDEIAQMREFWPQWREVLRPTLTDYKGEALFLSTPKGFNHFYDLFNEEKRNPDYKSFKFTSYDNPHLDTEEINTAKKELPKDQFDQEYMADFRKTQGLVYKEFDRERHVLSLNETIALKDMEWKEVLCGVDFGYKNPAAVITIKVDRDDNFYVTDEWYKKRQVNKNIINETKRMAPNMVYPDSAEPDRIKEFQDEGLYTMEVNKDIEYGVDCVQKLLKQNKVKIAAHCQNVIFEFETYRYRDKKPGVDVSEKPVKENDHAMDAIRYVLVTHTPHAIEHDFEDYKIFNSDYS